jgi:hypothetical protein
MGFFGGGIAPGDGGDNASFRSRRADEKERVDRACR